MVFNTLSVASAVTPSVIETYFSHFLHRAPLRQKPTAHISYHEGLRLIRQFLDYSSRHTVEDLQQFTAQWVPAPHWVRIMDIEIAPQFPVRAAKILIDQLGRRDVEKVGGRTWWQWRRPETPLRAEWIEMKKDWAERRRLGTKCERCILYVHGGAYYFGSVDEHRYQMQRHARKLKARVLAPRYRLAPQYPFPCGLFDCLAVYLYLLEHFRPEQILFMGDSAGGGMVLSLLVTLRDQGLPLPAGAVLLSPWVDLTHSFPSVAGDGAGDYIPPHGFHHRPSMAWPPPPQEERERKPKVFDDVPEGVMELPATAGLDMKRSKKRKTNADDVSDDDDDEATRPSTNTSRKPQPPHAALPGIGENLSLNLDGSLITIKDQIQLYCPNNLLSHPLVSPVQQPSLGGLPPLLIQIGGAELLRDEQVYLAHKAANPLAYPPSEAVLNEYDTRREMGKKWRPTDVQVQLWEDLCHVPHTLSFTRPAKFMYRGVAQFGAWALTEAKARKEGTSLEGEAQRDDADDDDDAVSIISDGPATGDEDSFLDDDGMSISAASTRTRTRKHKQKQNDDAASSILNGNAGKTPLGAVGKAGDPLPPFKDHMIRQRVTRHGIIYPLALPSEIACLHLDPATIGTIKSGPVRKWLAKKRENETRFASEAKKIQKKKAKEAGAGYEGFGLGEEPPMTSIVRRRKRGTGSVPEEKRRGKSWGLAMWSGWGSQHDQSTLEREERRDERREREGIGGAGSSRADVSSQQSQHGNGTGVNGRENGNESEMEREKKKQRRTSSASLLSAAAPWNNGGSRDRPRSPYRQAPASNTSLENSYPQPQHQPRPLYTNRSSTTPSTSSNLIPPSSRPISMATTSNPNLNLPPTTSAIAPESEKIPGSQNTFLAPGGDRPHNGVSAFPFRLRQEGSNPSIATLESGGTGTPVELSGEGVGRAVVVGELSGVSASSERVNGVGRGGSAGREGMAPVELGDTGRPHELGGPEAVVRRVMEAPVVPGVLPLQSSAQPQSRAQVPRGEIPRQPEPAVQPQSRAHATGEAVMGPPKAMTASALPRPGTHAARVDGPGQAKPAVVSESRVHAAREEAMAPIAPMTSSALPRSSTHATRAEGPQMSASALPKSSPQVPRAEGSSQPKQTSISALPESSTHATRVEGASQAKQMSASALPTSRPMAPPPKPTAEPGRDVVSPVAVPAGVVAAAAALEGDGTSPISPVDRPSPFRTRTPVFDPRTSILGSIGADGMPTAPLTARKLASDDEKSEVTTSEGASPVDASEQAANVPFKLRNPVFDPRVAASGEEVASESQVPPPPMLDEPKTSTDEPKAMPFKLRHAVLDPKLAPSSRSQTPEPTLPLRTASPPSSQPQPTTALPKEPTTTKNSEELTALPPFPAPRSSPPLSSQPNALPPNSNVTMPTAVARRPIAFRQTTGPKPPPKDEARAKSMVFKPGTIQGFDEKRPRVSDEKKSGENLGSMPKSRVTGRNGGTPPMLEDLKFDAIDLTPEDEERRPGVESFFTASSGAELRGRGAGV